MPVRRLPPELLQKVVELVHYSARGIDNKYYWQGGLPHPDLSYKDICAVMLVCREWKAIAEDILVEIVVVHTRHRIVALQNSLFKSHSAHGRSWGHRIQHLSLTWSDRFGPHSSSEQIVSSVAMAVLAQVSQLRSYSTRLRVMMPTEAAYLSAACASTLTSLSTSVQINSDGIFPIINSFVNLEYLSLHFFGTYFDGGGWDHSLDHPIRLTKLKALRWHHLHNDENLFTFLSRCVLGPECDVRLGATGLDSSDNIHLLRPFFTQNTFSALCLEALNPLLGALAPEIMLIQRIELGNVPPPAVLDVPSLPAIIFFPYYIDGPEDPSAYQDLWDFMQALVDSAIKPAHQTTTILIEMEDDYELKPRVREVFERLNTTATSLHERNIIIGVTTASRVFNISSEADVGRLTTTIGLHKGGVLVV